MLDRRTETDIETVSTIQPLYRKPVCWTDGDRRAMKQSQQCNHFIVSLYAGPTETDGLCNSRSAPFYGMPTNRVFVVVFTFYKCIVPMGFLPWEIRVAFHEESQLRQSRATQPRVDAGCFSVSIIRRTLTWTTGSLTCAQV